MHSQRPKIQNNVGPGQGRNQAPNQRNSHINENQLRSPGYSMQNIPMMIPQQQPRFVNQRAIHMNQRNIRTGQPTIYSSSPSNNMAPYGISPQGIPYQVPLQEQFAPSMFRPAYMPMHPSQMTQYQLPSGGLYQPQGYIPQPGTGGYYPGVQSVQAPVYVMQNQQPPTQQPQQQQTQQQQQQQGTQQHQATPPTSMASAVTKTATKPKKIIRICDPIDHKDVTDDILASVKPSSASSIGNGKTSTTTASPASSASNSTLIQADFAAKVAAAVAREDKTKHSGSNMKSEETEKTPESIAANVDTKALKKEITTEEQKDNLDSKAKTETEPKLAQKISKDNSTIETADVSTEVNKNAETVLPNGSQTDEEKVVNMQESLPVTENNARNISHEKDVKRGTPVEQEQRITLLKADRSIESSSSTSSNEIKNEVRTTQVNNAAVEDIPAVAKDLTTTENVHVLNKDSQIIEDDIETVKEPLVETKALQPQDTEVLNSDTSVQTTKTTLDNVDEQPTAMLNGKEPATDTTTTTASISDEISNNEPENIVTSTDSKEETPKTEPTTTLQPEKQLEKQPEKEMEKQVGQAEEIIKPEKQATVEAPPELPQQTQQQPEPTQQPKTAATQAQKQKKSKQRFKAMDKKGSEGDLMDAYTDNPPPAPEPVVEKVKPVEVPPKKVEKPAEEELSWEDKGEKIGDEIKIDSEPEPATETSIRKYERDFLLKFQHMQVCNEKPAGLPDIEVVLDAPGPKMNTSNRAPDFLPSFARQKNQSGGGGGRRDSHNKKPPRKIITPVNQVPVELNKSDNRWLRPQEQDSNLSEEEKKTNELYRIIVSILNKLTPQKFTPLVEQIMKLDISTPERLEGVIDRIFEKALSEPVFSVAYAKLCRNLFSMKVQGADDKDITFRKLLLNRCQKEFEKEGDDEEALNQRMKEVEEISDEAEKKLKKAEMQLEMASNKRRMLGNIKFIGELFKLKLLTENIMHDCIFKLLRAGDEESLESMCKLLFTIGKDLDSEKAKPRIQQYFEQIHKIIDHKKVSSRVTFMLRDVVDLRKNNWVPRREEHYNPKTIDQIHKEAKQEQEKSIMMHKEMKQQKKGGGGGGGGRDSPKLTQGNDGWMVSTRSGKSAPVDANKLKNMGKRSNVNENISLGPSSRFGQFGRNTNSGMSTPPEQEPPQGNRFSALSSGGGGSDNTSMPSNRAYDPRKSSTGSRPSSAGARSGDRRNRTDRDNVLDAVRSHTGVKPQPQAAAATAKPPVPPVVAASSQAADKVEAKAPVKDLLTKDQMNKKTIAIIEEYVNIVDIEEALNCFTELASPGLHDIFVATAVEHTYELAPRARTVTGRLLNELLAQKKMSKEQFDKGLSSVLGNADDFSIDYPKLWCYLADVISPIVKHAHYTMNNLKPLVITHLYECGKAGLLFAEILNNIASEDEQLAITLWSESDISWSELLPQNRKVEDFLNQKNLTFLLNEFAQVKKLLVNEETLNDEIFACIEKNFDADRRKQPKFIYELAKVVAESCTINKEDGEPDCCVSKLKARKNILHKYIDNNQALGVEVLYALQSLYALQNKPGQMLLTFFEKVYDEDIVTEESFLLWRSDANPERQEAKGSAIQATSSFFEWLQAAPEEANE